MGSEYYAVKINNRGMECDMVRYELMMMLMMLYAAGVNVV